MRPFAIIIAIVCAGCPPPTTRAAQSPQEPRTEPAAASRDCPPPAIANSTTAARRAELIAEIERLDRELDAIDGELAVAAQSSGRTLVNARIEALARKATLDAISADTPALPTGAPRMLVRPVRDLWRTRAEQARLGTELGPAHPEMKRVTRQIEHLRRTVSAQLDAERAFTQTWIETLSALPTKAKTDEVYKARLRALRATIAKAPSSDSPAAVQMAIERLAELTWAHAELSSAVGPKHPDMVVVMAHLDEATKALAAALAEADGVLAARITASTRAPDSAAIARRAELADTARGLRREYELLLDR